jgi:hypothetical protein
VATREITGNTTFTIMERILMVPHLHSSQSSVCTRSRKKKQW